MKGFPDICDECIALLKEKCEVIKQPTVDMRGLKNGNYRVKIRLWVRLPEPLKGSFDLHQEFIKNLKKQTIVKDVKLDILIKDDNVYRWVFNMLTRPKKETATA